MPNPGYDHLVDITLPILFYDADCGMCQKSVDWLASKVSDNSLRYIPYQSPKIGEDYPMISMAHSNRGVQLLLPSQKVLRNELAVAGCLDFSPRWWWLAKIIRFPLTWPFAAIFYRLVARNRAFISKCLGLTSCKFTPRH